MNDCFIKESDKIHVDLVEQKKKMIPPSPTELKVWGKTPELKSLFYSLIKKNDFLSCEQRRKTEGVAFICGFVPFSSGFALHVLIMLVL